MKNTQVVVVLLLLAILGVQVYSTFIKKEGYKEDREVSYSSPKSDSNNDSLRSVLPVTSLSSSIPKTGVVYKKALSRPSGKVFGSTPRAMDSGDYSDPTWVYQQTLNYATVDTQKAIDQIQQYLGPSNISSGEVQKVYNTIPPQYQANWLAFWVLQAHYGNNPYASHINSYKAATDMAASGCGDYCGGYTGPGALIHMNTPNYPS